MLIRFTKHALERISARNIDKSEILSTMNQPDNVKQDEFGVFIAQKKIHNLLLRIFYYEEEQTKIIITAYKTSKFEKYYPK